MRDSSLEEASSPVSKYCYAHSAYPKSQCPAFLEVASAYLPHGLRTRDPLDLVARPEPGSASEVGCLKCPSLFSFHSYFLILRRHRPLSAQLPPYGVWTG